MKRLFIGAFKGATAFAISVAPAGAGHEHFVIIDKLSAHLSPWDSSWW